MGGHLDTEEARGMTVHNDEWPEQIELDPRWEVQPESDDDSGGKARAIGIVLLAAVVIAILATWLVLNA